MRRYVDAEVYITPTAGSEFRTDEAISCQYQRLLDSSRASSCSIKVPLDVPLVPNSHVVIVASGEVVFRGWASDSWRINRSAKTREASCWGEEWALYYRLCPYYVYQMNEHRIIHPWHSDAPNQTATGTAPEYTMGLLWWANSGIDNRTWTLHHSGSNCFKIDLHGPLTRISSTGSLYVDGRLYTHRADVATVISTPYSWTQDDRYLYVAPMVYGPSCNVAMHNAFDTFCRLGSYTDSWNTTFTSPLRTSPSNRISNMLSDLANSYALYQVCYRTMDYTYIQPLDVPGRGEA